MSGSRKYSMLFVAALLASGFAGGANADTRLSAAKGKRAMQANAQYIAPNAALGSRELVLAPGGFQMCEQCPPMIVLGIGF